MVVFLRTVAETTFYLTPKIEVPKLPSHRIPRRGSNWWHGVRSHQGSRLNLSPNSATWALILEKERNGSKRPRRCWRQMGETLSSRSTDFWWVRWFYNNCLTACIMTELWEELGRRLLCTSTSVKSRCNSAKVRCRHRKEVFTLHRFRERQQLSLYWTQ